VAKLKPSGVSGDAPATIPGSPLWWLRRLHLGIVARKMAIQDLQMYYDGEFSLRYADKKLRATFGDVFYANRFGLNFMRLIVNAVEERLRVEGIRVGGKEDSDPVAWDIWQAANLDETSSTAHTEALINGVSYATVWPSDDPKYPDITIEHPAQAIVERNPKRPKERLAGLRMYVDEYGYLHAELFLPDAVYLFKSDASRDTAWDPGRMLWVYDSTVPTAPDGVMDNPWGVVPMVPFENLPRLALNTATVSRDVAKRSELWPVMPIQDKINSLVFNMLLTANSQGYRQRWVTGLDLEVDEDGKPKEPFKAGIDRLFVAQSETTKFGEFSTTDVSPLIAAIEMLFSTLGSISQVPPHYFSASADRLSAESIKAAETGLVSKVVRRQISFGGAWEEVMRIAGLMTGNAQLAEARAAEMIWGNPETRSDAQLADAVLKKSQVGVPWRTLMEDLGYSPQQIDRMETERESDAAKKAAEAPPTPAFLLGGAQLPSLPAPPPDLPTPPPPPAPA
jgi:hypothetical protein